MNEHKINFACSVVSYKPSLIKNSVHRILSQYKVILCPHCGLVQYVKEGQKKRKCPNTKCRKSINIEQVIVYARTYEIQKAVQIVQQIKEKRFTLHKMEDIHPLLDEGIELGKLTHDS